MEIKKYFYSGFILLAFVLAGTKMASAQNVGISSSSSFTPDASAALDVSFTNKGLLVPRVALTANNVAGPVSSPATSLMVYNTATAGTSPNNVIPGYYYWNGSIWVMLTTSVQATNNWATTGNAGTSYPTNFFGTTDNFGLHFKTNATHRMWLDSLGSVAVGTSPTFSSSRERFLVDAGTTTSYNVISGKGNLNNYLQLNIQNLNAGGIASSDVVATADNGTESINYIDMGINSSGNTSGSFGAANDAYLYNTGGSIGGNLFIGTNTSGKALGFLTGGGAASNERMRIDGNGNVGIGTTTPSTKLHVFGANPLTLSGVVAGTNTTADSLLTITSGLVRKLPVSAFATPTNAWATTGNAGTSPSTNFLGTTDNNSLLFRSYNTQKMVLDTLGVAIGISPTFTSGAAHEKLLVDAGSTSSNPSTTYNVISGKGYLDSYLQLNIQNLSPTTAASTDIVASNDQASETTNFIDMGINSSTNNTTGAIGGANTAYIYGTGNDMAIGNGTANKSLIFFTGGTSPTTYTERIRLDASGRVGIGTNSPTSDLTLFQSSGTGGTKGFRLAGNSISGNSSGTGFLMSLGYNTSGNKQLWLGDPDYAGSSSGTFVRFGVNSGNIAVFDAISGDNATRKYLALGVAGDSNSGVIFGNDNNSATPGSLVWTNGNMTIGNSYRASAAPANGLIVQGNVGIATNAPTSTLTVTGSFAGNITTKTSSSNTYIILATDYVIINSATSTSSIPQFNLPAANTCSGRVYLLVNHGANSLNISPAVYVTNATAASIPATAGSNVWQVISDGTNWHKIN